MPEAKNNFLKGRMNKDLDERLLQSGEYRDARNVSVSGSDTGNSGSLENVKGTSEVTDFGLTDRNIEIIGKYEDLENDRLIFFLTNYTDSSATALDRFASTNSSHYIFCYDVKQGVYYKLVEGNFLNFSKTHPILQVNLIEDLLFWNDDRNQPRKINLTTAIQSSPSISTTPYYSKEEHISVAKYYPWNAIRLYKRSYELENTDSNYGRLNDYNHSLFDRITTLFDTATLGTSTTYNVNVTSISTPESTTSGSGDNATVVLYTDSAGNISDIQVTFGGDNFAVGDTITFVDPTGVTSDEMTVVLTEQDFWIEPTTKDTVSTLLPYSAEATSAAWGTSSSGTMVRSDASQDLEVFDGCLIYVEDNAGSVTVPISDGIYIESISFTSGNSYSVTLSGDPITIASTDTIYIGANPYYNEDDIATISNIKDKFVRFAYRFKYDDNEYSLISPFTQPVFIPRQDGHFTGNSTTIDKDEQDTIKSSNVDFFENKVTEVELVIDLPEGVGSVTELITDMKVKEVDILYKDANEPSIKVVKTINEDDLAVDSNDTLKYTYKSTKPTKVLPERELTRVYDKIPVRAKAQESVGNRIIFGNYLPSFASLDSLDYSASYGEKSYQGDVNDAYSKREYPSHTLKQNRTYQVGIVLADKFGRKSDPIISDNSTVFSRYKDAAFSMISSADVYGGDALKVTFNQDIPNETSNPLYMGVYNETDNPMGWYSYQVVVKQKEQSYHNAYAPSLLNGYPKQSTNINSDIAHITLVGDNINKIPRDFELSNEGDNVFRSKTQLYPRVLNDAYTSGEHDSELYVGDQSPQKVSIIGYRDDMGLNNTESGTGTINESAFFSIPDLSTNGSNPLIARLSTREALGAEGGNTGITGRIAHNMVRLNALETRPFESDIEIYWETSTSGLISELNESVLLPENSDGIPYQISGFEFLLDEESVATDTVSTAFTIQDFSGNDILNANTTGTVVSARNKNGLNFPNKFTVNKNGSNQFYLTYNGNPTEYFNQNSYTENNYDIVVEFTNVVDGQTVKRRIPIPSNLLINLPPTFDEDGLNLGDVSTDIVFSRSGSNVQFITPTTGWREVSDIVISNGSIYNGVGGYDLRELDYNIDRVEWYNTSLSTWIDYWYIYNTSPTLYTRDPLGLVKLIFSDSPSHDMKILYSPVLQWGWFDRQTFSVTNQQLIDQNYAGESAVLLNNYGQVSLTSLKGQGFFDYSSDSLSMINVYKANSSTIPSNGLQENQSLTDKKGLCRVWRNVSSQSVLTSDMQVRVTFTLYDVNRSGISKQFTALFDIEYGGYDTFNDI